MMSRLLMLVFSLGALCVHAPLVAASPGLPDPTRPQNMVLPETSATPAQHFILGSVLISSQRSVAIINGERVTVGAQVDGATIRKIEKNRVELVSNGRVITLNLANHDFKQRK